MSFALSSTKHLGLNGVQESHAMTLSTVNRHGCPGARVLILMAVDSRNWYFAVNRHSLKAEQLDVNQNVADIGRPIRVRKRLRGCLGGM